MKHAYVFPGQGAQAVGMGKDLYDNVPEAKALFEQANEILGFRITDIMFAGTPDELKQTKVTQPAVFLHSVILAKALGVGPDMVAGHSLGEFSALVVAGALSFEDGLRLVSKRALAMQAACEAQPGTMAAILGLADEVVEQACAETDGVVVAANYNCPGQLVISGAVEAVDAACEKLKAAGARRALRLPVGGAFHSPKRRSIRPSARSIRTWTPNPGPIRPLSARTSSPSSRLPSAGPRSCGTCSPTARRSLPNSAPATCSKALSRRSTPKPPPSPARRSEFRRRIHITKRTVCISNGSFFTSKINATDS